MRDIKASEALNLAADFIQINGWGRGPKTWNTDNNNGVCIEGAIAAVMGVEMLSVELDDGTTSSLPNLGELTRCPAYEAVNEYLEGSKFGWLFHWNDAKGRTQEEVISVLRSVAVIEEAKENSKVEQAA